MYQLEIQFENEAYLKVLTTKDIESELSEYFKFMSPGHKFDPRVKHGLWDGAIRLYSLKTKTMYRGLLPELIEFCKERGYAYNLQSYQKPDLDLDQIQYIEDHLLDKITLHDYQRSSVLYAAENDRSIIVSPTGSGKSAIIYTLSLFYILNGFKTVLIIVPTTSLVEQMYKDFITYHKGDRREFAETIQRISGEYSKEIDVKSNFVISTWQSIYKFPNEWFNQFDCIIGDETHKFKSGCLTDIMAKATDVKFRHGTTATLSNKDSKVHTLILKGLFGTPQQTATTKELIDRKILSQIQIYAFRFKYADKKLCTAIKKLSFQEEVKAIAKIGIRNSFVCKLAQSLKGNTLVMFQFKEQGEKLFTLLQDGAEASGKEVFYIDGSVPTAERERIRELAETRDNLIIVASFGVYSTGINLKNLHHLILHTAFKSSILMKQTIGRGLRTHESKEKICIYDIGDDFSNDGKPNITFHHFKERIKLYRQEKFAIKLQEYTIQNNKITKL